jgi:hypothetical protein
MSKFKTFLLGLFVNGVGGCSLGRVSFWCVFALAMWICAHDKDIAIYHFAAFMALLGYQITGKWLNVKQANGVQLDAETKEKS